MFTTWVPQICIDVKLTLGLFLQLPHGVEKAALSLRTSSLLSICLPIGLSQSRGRQNRTIGRLLLSCIVSSRSGVFVIWLRGFRVSQVTEGLTDCVELEMNAKKLVSLPLCILLQLWWHGYSSMPNNLPFCALIKNLPSWHTLCL